MYHYPEEGPHHRPEGHYQPRENGAEMGGESQRSRGDEISGYLGEVDEGNGDQLNGFGQQSAADGRNGHVYGAEYQTDHGACREDPPAPALQSLGGLGQRRGSLCRHGCKWERQALIVGVDPKQDVGHGKPQDPRDYHAGDHQRDGHSPIAVEEGAQHQGLRIDGRGPPGRNQFCESELLGRGRLHQVLVPKQSLENPGLGGDQARRHVVEEVDFLAPEGGERALDDLGEKDDRDPFGRCPE